ncbi:MAG: FtsW/RodA/SpoVE family cell cycle protein [Bacteroidota bacterium]
MNELLSRLKGDKLIWLVIFFISMISLLAVYTGAGSPALASKAGTEYYLLKHAMLLFGGFVIMYFVSNFDYRIFARISDYLLYLTIPVLVYTLLWGKDINDASRWITIFGQSFQPSDLGKVALVIHLAKVLTQKQDVIKDFREGFLPTIFWVLLICLLIAPADLSTATLLFVTSLMILFIAGVDLKYITSLILLGAVAVTVLFSVAQRRGTWESRIDSYWLSLTDDSYDPPYQVKQAYGAMATGGVFGKGPGKSTQRNFVPNSTSDMIYPIIIEEHGFIGAIVVLGLYLFLLFRSVGIVTMSKTFGAILAAGLSLLLVIQALANMAVAVGLLPVTGLPLPMLSMGGTSILFTAFSIGIILSVSRHALENGGKKGGKSGGKKGKKGKKGQPNVATA